MATLTYKQISAVQREEKSAEAAAPARPQTASGPPARAALSQRKIDERLERTRVRAVIAIVAGVAVVSFVLAVLLLGWSEAAVGTLGITLTALLFGSPFWLASIDASVESEQSRIERGV